MCYRVFIDCRCTKFKIVHSLFYIEENGHFVYEKVNIYLEGKLLTEQKGKCEKNENTKKLRIIGCRCNRCRCIVDSFTFYVDEKNLTFYIKDVTCFVDKVPSKSINKAGKC
jgi:hypothetical protein